MRASTSFLLATFATAALVSSVRAEWYAGTSVGYQLDDNKSVVSTRFGYTFEPASNGAVSNVELELLYLDSGGEDDSRLPVMLNYRVAFPLTKSLTADVGAGAGVVFSSLESSNADFAANAQAGLSYRIAEALSARVGYRYVTLGGGDINTGILEAGVNLQF